MKIAITGSTGFIGKALVYFFAEHHDIIAFWRKKSPFHEGISYESWDITKILEKKFSCDIFIHAASDVGYEKTSAEMIQNNVHSGANIIQALEESWCKHFIYISSSSVYMGIHGSIREDVSIDTKNLTNSYALSKYLAEQYFLENLPRHIRYSVIRPRAVYGKGDTTLLPKIVKLQIFWRIFLIWSGKIATSVTHIDNLCQALEIIISQYDIKYEIYNVSDISPITYEEIYRKISKVYWLNGFYIIPIFFLQILKNCNYNKVSYLLDTFWYEKTLDISKMRKLWYNPSRNIDTFFQNHETLP